MPRINAYVLPQRNGGKNPATSYLEDLGSRKSAITMTSCLNRVATMYGFESFLECDWSALRRPHIQSILKKLKSEGLAPSTINVYLACLKGVAKEAWSSDLMPQSAYLKISSMTAIRYERLPVGRSLSYRECKRLLATCDDGTVVGKRDKAILAMMMGCGLRRAEVVELNLQNWDSRTLSIRLIGKGNKERKVFLPTDLESIVKDWISVRGETEGPMFPRLKPGTTDLFDRKHMNPCSIYRLLQGRSFKASLRGLTPHDLRRTFATRMLENGCDLFLLQRAMGHSTVATTARYDRRGERSREKVCRNLKFL